MHIELTSRCTLECPGCSRTWFSQKFNRPFPKQDLDIDAFVRFMSGPAGSSVKDMLLCGNHGDPIYYPKLFEFIDRFRQCNFKISTNGSHQPSKFWHGLNQHLDHNDTLYFSIDGLEHNNHLYRRNSDWSSIMTALDIATQGPARIVWKSIIFKYNQMDILAMQKMAHEKGVDFVAEPTSYYGDNSLRPDESALIRFDRQYEFSKSATQIDPKCGRGSKEEYISADGYYWPCCQISNMHVLHRTPLWADKHNWTIKDHTLDELRDSVDKWAQFVETESELAPDSCKMNCKPKQSGPVWINY